MRCFVLALIASGCAVPPAPETSISITPVRILGDGRASATITVHVTRADGTPAARWQLACTSSVASDVITPVTPDTGSDGVLVATLRATEGGARTVTCTTGSWKGVAGMLEVTPVMPACADPVFSHESIEVAYDFAVGDLDNDGLDDLAVIRPGDRAFVVQRGHGNAGFAPAELVVANPFPPRIALGDFDRDGVLDAVTALTDIELARGTGDGTFAPAQTIGARADQSIYGIAVGDVNRNGTLDVVGLRSGAALSGASLVQIFDGDGRGALAPGFAMTGDGEIDAAVLADFGTGRPDLAAVGFESSMPGARSASVLHNWGDSLGAREDVEMLDDPVAIDVGDLDGDGALDIVTAHPWTAPPEVVVDLARDHWFQSAHVVQPGIQASSIAVGDLTNDGHLDVVAFDGVQVVILAGRGDGSFVALAPHPVDLSTGIPGPSRVALADVDADGRLDIVTDKGAVLVQTGCR